MPIYEYWCSGCRRRVSILWATVAAAATSRARCPRCRSTRLERLVSRVAPHRSGASRLESLAGPEGLSGADEDDPRAVARWMRRMGEAVGEDLGEEFDEMVDRLEAGEDPESVAGSMGDGDDADTGSGP